MWNDLRFALRQLAAARGFTITATVTLALGIGATTGIFTLIYGVMMKSLPVADPQRIVRVGDGDNCCVLGGLQGRFALYSYALYNHLRENTPEFEEMSAFQGGLDQAGVRRAGSNMSDPFVDQFVSGNYFTLFGLRPFAGRLIDPSDDRRGSPPVAVISYRAWQQHYAGDRSVIGSTFIIEGSPFTVIGVAPPGFFGAELRPNPPDFWMPLAAEPATHGKNSLLDQATSHWLYVFGRLKPGIRPQLVEAKVNAALQQWLPANEPVLSDRERQEIPKQHIALAPGGAGVSAMKEEYERDLRLLFGITGLVLLIACANLANLQLARGAKASVQTSIRIALGAPRSRLIRQVLIESLLLAVAGGALGLLVADQTAGLLIRLAFHGASYVPISTTPSLAVLGFAFAAALFTGVLFGIAPAWAASRADPAASLHGAGRSGAVRSTLTQRMLVIVQAALSLVLLTGAGLMMETLNNLTGQQFGFRMENRAVVNVDAGFGSYSPERLGVIYDEAGRQVRLIPGVRNVALALYSPMSGNNWQMGATLERRPQARISPSWDRVSASFFDTIGARIVRGRGFNERDTPNTPRVTVINEEFARQYLPNEDPIGQRFGLGGVAHSADYTIVGVVNTIRFRNPRGPGRPMFFLPLLQMTAEDWKDTTKARSNIIQSMILQVDGQVSDLAPRIHRTLAGIDPNLTMLSVIPMSGMLDGLLGHEHLIGTLAQVFGLLALLLASVGLYGVTTYSVARRTREIGVRTALGATRANVVRMVLKSALGQAAIGVALGALASLATGGVLADQLFGVKDSDPVILGAASIVLVACAALAALVPALRAGSVDPVMALRIEN